jgi:digeranylgeranylglycerophospholipid reductase
MKKINCDVVVVGAGPGGSMAAKTCAKYGLDTVLVERKEYPNRPYIASREVTVRIFDYMKIDKKYIEYPIYKMVDISPDGTELLRGEPYGYEMAYVVNRKKFDKEILKIALKEGPEYLNKTRATGLIRENGNIKGIKAKINKKEDVEIRSNIVIGADGIESKVGRWAGIYKRGYGLNDISKSIIFDSLIDNVNIKDKYKYAHIHIFGKARGGAIFISQIGDGKVGVGTDSVRPNSPRKMGEFLNFLNKFIENNPIFSGGKIVETGFGVMPYSPLKKITTDEVMLVGDAAHQIDTPHKTGILNSMDAGVLAGETAVEAHEEGDFSSNLLSNYEKRWYRLYGEHDILGSYILEVIHTMSDEHLNRIFHILKDNNELIVDDAIKELLKTSKLASSMIYELKKEGLNVSDFASFFSLLKKYHRTRMDLYFQ